jgi:cysteine desulfurase
MEPFLAPAEAPGSRFGNPSGSHAVARDALRALDEAREQVAHALGCRPGEVVFTSGGTEADNLAVSGGVPPRAGIPVCSAVEHPAVLEATAALAGEVVVVDRAGRVDLDALEATLLRLFGSSSPVSVVSVMTANNELGTVNDIAAVSEVVRRCAPGTPLHTDAVQAAPWLDVGVLCGAADLVSVSAHKLGGPKGAGALVVRDTTTVAPLFHGGGQERERRGGTHNMAGIVGFAAALSVAARDRAERTGRVMALRDDLAARLTALAGVTATLAESGADVLPGHLHLLIDDVVGEELLLLLEQQGVCASAASSCASGAVGASHVVQAIGLDDPHQTPLRLSLGVDTTAGDVDATVVAMETSLTRARGARLGTGARTVGGEP